MPLSLWETESWAQSVSFTVRGRECSAWKCVADSEVPSLAAEALDVQQALWSSVGRAPEAT